MLNHLRALGVFAKVADAGSFRAAARQLGISASVVSHHVTSLESYLDTPLTTEAGGNALIVLDIGVCEVGVDCADILVDHQFCHRVGDDFPGFLRKYAA